MADIENIVGRKILKQLQKWLMIHQSGLLMRFHNPKVTKSE